MYYPNKKIERYGQLKEFTANFHGQKIRLPLYFTKVEYVSENDFVPFPRIDLHAKRFLESWILKIEELASIDSECFRLLMLYRLTMALGRNFQGDIVNFKPYDPISDKKKSTKQEGIDFSQSMKLWEEVPPEKIWLNIPKALKIAVFQEHHKIETLVSLNTESLYETLLPRLIEEGGKDIDTSSNLRNINNFINKLRQSNKIPNIEDSLKALVLELFIAVNKDITNSMEQVIHLFEEQKVMSDKELEITKRYINFWYTNKGPWAKDLQGLVADHGCCASSFYYTLSDDNRLLFDEYVFIKNLPPPSKLLKNIISKIAHYPDWLDKVKRIQNSPRSATSPANYLEDDEDLEENNFDPSSNSPFMF